MPGEIELYVAKVQQGGAEILFHLILLLPPGLDGGDQRAPIDNRNIEILHEAVKVQNRLGRPELVLNSGLRLEL